MTSSAEELTTQAFCWKLERRDGVALGFTTHDRDLLIDDLLYRAAPGMLPSAISISAGFAASSLEVSGGLTSEAITARDLQAGRWDGASIEILLVDWEDVERSPEIMARGVLGDISMSGKAFTSELLGPAALLDRPVVEQTSPQCRAELGDKRCRVDMAHRTKLGRIVAIVSGNVIGVDAGLPDNMAYGRLRWISGANSGLESGILASEGGRVTLREEAQFAPAPGDVVEVREGCDKVFSTCVERFSNAVNFRGEPHLPGNDLLTRYPGA